MPRPRVTQARSKPYRPTRPSPIGAARAFWQRTAVATRIRTRHLSWLRRVSMRSSASRPTVAIDQIG